MHPITITTVVRNPATLPLLLALTDKFYSDGLLTKLRVIDCTSRLTDTAVVRSLVPMDGSSNTQSIVVDYSTVQQRDSRAYISAKTTGYRYETTGFKLQKGGDRITVAVRSTHGGSVWVSAGGRGAAGIEVVLSNSGCFIRRGKGGGTKVQEILDSGVVEGGTGWRTIELSWSHDDQFVAALDTGSVLACAAEFGGGDVDVNTSSSPTGVADIVVTSLPSSLLGLSIDRSYAYYYKQPPPAETEGFELVSKNDIVYIDPVEWKNIIESDVTLVSGDDAHLSALQLADILKQDQDTHSNSLDQPFLCVEKIDSLNCSSSLDQLFRCIEKIGRLNADSISFNVADGTYISRVGAKSTTGLSSLLRVLEADRINDLNVIDRYSSLISQGPEGAEEKS